MQSPSPCQVRSDLRPNCFDCFPANLTTTDSFAAIGALLREAADPEDDSDVNGLDLFPGWFGYLKFKSRSC